MKSIAFFGASITQQKTGYVHHFAQLNPGYRVLQFGYGGMYIHDAGICFIDSVVREKPNFCFIDWFSPRCYTPPEKIQEYLDVILMKLFSIKCKPIFLFFYRSNLDHNWLEMFQYLKSYANQYRINTVDLTHQTEPTLHLKDGIHTNDLGSKHYATIINDNFIKMHFPEFDGNISTNQWQHIEHIDTNIIAHKYIEISSEGCSQIVGIMQSVGPYSGNIYCTADDAVYTVDTSDRWSVLYERRSMKSDIKPFCHKLHVDIPDGNKAMWEQIFYIGNKITIINYE